MLGKHRLGPRFACLDLPFVLLFSSHLLPKHCLSRLRWSDWSESLVLSMMIQFLKDATCTGGPRLEVCNDPWFAKTFRLQGIYDFA